LSNLKIILTDKKGLQDFQTFDVNAEWQSFTEKVKSEYGLDLAKEKRNYTFKQILFYALILFFIGGLGYVVFEKTSTPPSQFQYAQTLDKRDTIYMADGSQIYLEPYSSLKYPVDIKNMNARNLTLSGDAKFDVARDVNRPFKVVNDKIFIQVLGTVFNIENTEEGTKIENEEGSVKIAEVSNEDNFKVLEKGDIFTYKDGKFEQVLPPAPEAPVINHTKTYTLYNVYEHLYRVSNGKIVLSDVKKVNGRALVYIDLTQDNKTILDVLRRKHLISYERGDCNGCYVIYGPK